MATTISKSPEETLRLGDKWGQEARPGWVIALTGDLGAGKTQLVKGIARGLGIAKRVHSPTFTLVNEYEGGRLPLSHLDLYRLETREQIVGAGLEEYFERPKGVMVVEWAERWFGAAPSPECWISGWYARLRRVKIETLREQERLITYEDSGA